MSEKKPEKTEKEPSAETREREQPKEPAPKKPYVFKILPADPKNSFDFEDVADK